MTAFLYSEIGIAGLVPLVGVVLLPRLLVPILLRDGPIWDLSIGEATARYAAAWPTCSASAHPSAGSCAMPPRMSEGGRASPVSTTSTR